MKKLAFAGLGLLIVLAAIAPLVTGSVTESSWREMSQEINNSGGGVARLETVEYDKSYLTSDVLSKLILNFPDTEGPVEIYLRSEIAHGLLRARSETRLDPEFHSEWLEYFEGEVPLLVSTAGVAGNVDGRLTVPAVSRTLDQQGQLDLRPVDMAFATSKGGDAVHLTLTWDGLTLAQAGNALRVGKVSLTEELERLTGELWVGDVGFSISEFETETAEGNSATLKGITLSGSTHETAGDRLKNQVDVGVEDIAVGGERFGDMRMVFVADDFDIQATNATLEAGNRLNEVAAGDQNSSEQAVEQLKLFGEFMDTVRNLMAHGLKLEIPTLVLNTPEGAVELDFRFVHPQLDDAQRDDMMSLFQHSSGGINLRMPAAVMETMPPDFQQQVGQLYQQGLIAEENGILKLTIELEKMTLNVNGNPIPIPPII